MFFLSFRFMNQNSSSTTSICSYVRMRADLRMIITIILFLSHVVSVAIDISIIITYFCTSFLIFLLRKIIHHLILIILISNRVISPHGPLVCLSITGCQISLKMLKFMFHSLRKVTFTYLLLPLGASKIKKIICNM